MTSFPLCSIHYCMIILVICFPGFFCRVNVTIESNTEVTEGDTLELICRVTEEDFMLTWLFGASLLAIDNDVTAPDFRIYTNRPYIHEYVLRITNVAMKDAGTYKCFSSHKQSPRQLFPVTVKPKTAEPKQSPQCPKRWQSIADNKCVRLFQTRMKTAVKARRKCKINQGGKLLRIHSQKELQLIITSIEQRMQRSGYNKMYFWISARGKFAKQQRLNYLRKKHSNIKNQNKSLILRKKMAQGNARKYAILYCIKQHNFRTSCRYQSADPSVLAEYICQIKHPSLLKKDSHYYSKKKDSLSDIFPNIGKNIDRSREILERQVSNSPNITCVRRAGVFNDNLSIEKGRKRPKISCNKFKHLKESFALCQLQKKKRRKLRNKNRGLLKNDGEKYESNCFPNSKLADEKLVEFFLKKNPFLQTELGMNANHKGKLVKSKNKETILPLYQSDIYGSL